MFEKLRNKTILLYGNSGVGKTTLAGKILKNNPNTIYINTDGNYKLLLENGYVKDPRQIIEIKKTADGIFDIDTFINVLKSLKELTGLENIVIDSISHVFEDLTYHSAGVKNFLDYNEINKKTSFKHWETAKLRAKGILGVLQSLNKNIFLISHEKTTKDETFGTINVPNMRSEFFRIIQQSLGAVWRLTIFTNLTTGTARNLFVNNNINNSQVMTFFVKENSMLKSVNMIKEPNFENITQFLKQGA